MWFVGMIPTLWPIFADVTGGDSLLSWKDSFSSRKETPFAWMM
jgi:hypothetical protein